MSVDPSEPDTFQDEDSDAAEVPDEANEEDVAEQRTGVGQSQDDPLTGVNPDTANEADAVEQARVVSLDEDDYR